jgi:hypothetical protein
MIQTYNTGQRPSQMVWAAIWLDERGRLRRSPLVIMERAPRGEYSSKSYISALTEGLLPHWRRSQQFMQDNARVPPRALYQYDRLASLLTQSQSN